MSKEFYHHSLSSNDQSRQDLPQEHNSNELLEIEELIAPLPKEKRKVLRELILALVERVSWNGPLPPPKDLKEYNETFPGGAETLFRMVEKQADHRMETEKKIISKQQRHGELDLQPPLLLAKES